MVNSRPGRPAGGSDARERLLSAAATLFETEGYTAATVRRIAAHAGVDHALVNYHFGGKEGLFAEVFALETAPGAMLARVLEADPALRAEHVLDTVLRVWDAPGAAERMRALLADVAADEGARRAFEEYVRTRIIARFAEADTGAGASARASAAAVVILGLLVTRYVARIGPLAQASRPEVVAILAPVLRSALDGGRGRGVSAVRR